MSTVAIKVEPTELVVESLGVTRPSRALKREREDTPHPGATQRYTGAYSPTAKRRSLSPGGSSTPSGAAVTELNACYDIINHRVASLEDEVQTAYFTTTLANLQLAELAAENEKLAAQNERMRYGLSVWEHHGMWWYTCVEMAFQMHAVMPSMFGSFTPEHE